MKWLLCIITVMLLALSAFAEKPQFDSSARPGIDYHKLGYMAFVAEVGGCVAEGMSLKEAKEVVFHQVRIEDGEHYDGIMERFPTWRPTPAQYALIFMAGVVVAYYCM